MQAAARPYLAAGVALIGAGAIAISPVAPPMPDITVPAISSAEVNLSAATDPIQTYIDLFTNTFTNVQARIGDELADPAPILLQIFANQLDSAQSVATALQAAGESLAKSLDPANQYGLPARFQEAFQDLLAGNINSAVTAAWQGILVTALGALPALTAVQNAITQPVVNLGKVVSDPQIVLLPAVGLLVPIYATLSATGNVGQNIVDAAKAVDPLGVLGAMASAPAVIGDALINDGLLGSSGLLVALRTVRQRIATDITPTAAVTTAPQAKATTVTLDVVPQAPNARLAAAPVAAASVENSTATDDSAAADTSASVTTPADKDSLTAAKTVTKPATKASPKAQTKANPAKAVRDQVKSAVKKMTSGLKKDKAGAQKGAAKKAQSHHSAKGASK